MLYDTVAEYDTEITITREAISRIIQIGHAHSNRSGVSELSTTEIRLKTLRQHLTLLINERDLLNGTGFNGPVLIDVGW